MGGKTIADMKCLFKTSSKSRMADVLRDNEGTSLVLVTIIAIIIVTSVIVLTVNVNTLIASANQQYNQDQAYEAARSMGSSLDDLINEHKLALDSFITESNKEVMLVSDNGSFIEVEAKVKSTSTDTYVITVTANTSNQTYVYSATYCGSGTTYIRVS